MNFSKSYLPISNCSNVFIVYLYESNLYEDKLLPTPRSSFGLRFKVSIKFFESIMFFTPLHAAQTELSRRLLLNTRSHI